MEVATADTAEAVTATEMTIIEIRPHRRFLRPRPVAAFLALLVLRPTFKVRASAHSAENQWRLVLVFRAGLALLRAQSFVQTAVNRKLDYPCCNLVSSGDGTGAICELKLFWLQVAKCAET